MKKFLLAAITSAIATGWTGMAAAQVNLNTGAGSQPYANELVVNNTTPVALVTTTNKLGFGVSAQQRRFIRYDLTNAKLAAAVLPGALTFAAPALAPSSTVIAQGGAANGTFVTFEITSAGNGQDDVVNFAPGNLIITDKSGSATIKYSLYETAEGAALGGATALLATASAAVATFPSGLTFAAVSNSTEAEVTTDYKQFNNGVSSTIAKIGTVTFAPNESVRNPDGGLLLTTADMGKFTATGTKLVLTGLDLSAAKESTPPVLASTPGLYLAGLNQTCSTAAGKLQGSGRTATTVDFVIGTTAVGTNPVAVPPNPPANTGRDICFEATGTTPIAAQDFTVAATVVAATGSTTANQAAINAGNFKRNGLVLKTAFAETTTAAGISSSIHLNNTSGAAAPFTVSCVLNSGSVAGTPGSIPALTAQRFSLSSGLGCPTNGTLRGVEITFATAPGNVIGSVVRQNTTTGLATFDNMVGNTSQ